MCSTVVVHMVNAEKLRILFATTSALVSVVIDHCLTVATAYVLCVQPNFKLTYSAIPLGTLRFGVRLPTPSAKTISNGDSVTFS